MGARARPAVVRALCWLCVLAGGFASASGGNATRAFEFPLRGREAARESAAAGRVYADVERPAQVRVCYLDRDGAPQEIEGDGLLAVCLQHEIDHVDGVLFVDHISALKRNIMLKKMVKAKKLRSRESDA